MIKDADKIGVTKHAYGLIRVNITKQDGNMKQNINNAKRFGLDYRHEFVSKEINAFVKYVIWKYHSGNDKSQRDQNYLIYGYNLYIFRPDMSKLITVFQLPENLKEDAAELKKKTRNRKSNPMKDLYDKPLNEPVKTRKKKRKKKKKALVK